MKLNGDQGSMVLYTISVHIPYVASNLADSLTSRFTAASLQIMQHTVNKNALSHLQPFKPQMRSDIHGANTRKATNKTLNQPKVFFQIILLHYNVLHGQTEFDPSYGNPQ